MNNSLNKSRAERRQLRMNCLACALLMGLAGGAFAQDAVQSGAKAKAKVENTAAPADEQDADGKQKAEADSDKKDAKDLETVVVTGTHIEGINPVGSDLLVLDKEQIQATGMSNAADVLRTLPQMQNIGEFREGGTQGSGNSAQGNALNLRGIGISGTLLLIDGRRVSQSGTAQAFTEANQVPLSALERVEVIADGASAVYGSDAVAGIVNYVMRKDYEGVEVTLKHDNLGDYNEETVGISMGRFWNLPFGRGNALLTFERGKREAFLRGDNPYLRQDLTAFGGLDGRLSSNGATPGIPGNIVVGTTNGATNPNMPTAGAYVYYGLPAGTNGVGLTYADLRMNQPNLLDSSDYTDWTGKVDRKQATLYVNQEFSPKVSAFLQASFNDRDTVSRSMTGQSGVVINDISIAPGQPFYISGFPMAPPQIIGWDPVLGFIYGPQTPPTLQVQYNAFKDIGHGTWNSSDRSLTWTAGVKAELAGGWKGEFTYTDSSSKTCGYCIIGNYVNPEAFKAQVAAGNINPFSTAPLSDAQVATFIGSNVQKSESGMQHAVLKFNGPLFSIPGGKVRAAAGVEYNKSSQSLFNEANRNADNAYIRDTVSNLERDVKSAFAEFYIPVIGKDNAVTGIKELSLSAAYRYDKYSDAGKASNPKLGFTWAINDDFKFRGSWGTSFRSPNLPERNPGVFSARIIAPFGNNSGDPAIVNAFPGTTIAALFFGSNANLKPEESTNWSAGFDWELPVVEGLRLSTTYYTIEYEGRISSPNIGEFLSSPESYALYKDYIHVVNNPVTCVNGNPSTYDPKLTEFMAMQSLYNTSIFPDCSVSVILDGRYTNIASTKQHGVDANLNYALPTDIGFWNFSWNATKILKNEQQVVEGGAVQTRLDKYYEPSSLRQRGAVSWYDKGWMANLFVNYTGSYSNDLPITINGVVQPVEKIGAWITADLNLGYEKTLDAGWFSGFRVNMNINNLTDKAPPVVLSGSTAYNPVKSNPWGRTWSMSLTLDF